jgi:hypothetical protein
MGRTSKIVLIIVGILAGFYLLFFLTLAGIKNYTFQQLKRIGVTIPKEAIPKEIIPNQSQIGGEFEEKIINYKEFISPDEKFKLKYPQDCIEIKNPALFKEFAPQKLKEKYGLEILFLGLKLQGAKSLSLQEMKSFLFIVGKGNFSEGFDKAAEEIKKINEEENVKTKNIKIVPEKKEIIYEGEHQSKEGILNYLKEKYFLSDQTFYLLISITPEKNLSDFEKEIDEIFDSAQILD